MNAFSGCTSLNAVYLPPNINRIGDYAFKSCYSLRYFYVPEEIEHLGVNVVDGCDQLLTTVKYKKDTNAKSNSVAALNNDEVNEWLMQRHAYLPFHKACTSTSITPPRGIEVCFQEHGIERATEVDNQHVTALHILCANPHVTGDAICSYLQLAPEVANAQDSYGMTPFQYLCRNDITFFFDDRVVSLHALMFRCATTGT